jgi:hypothetical protein
MEELMQTLRTAVSSIVTVALAAACSSSNGVTGSTNMTDATVKSYEGVYQLLTFNENLDGCATLGPSTFETKTNLRFVLVGSELVGMLYLTLASCLDDADCASKVGAMRSGGGYSIEYSVTLDEQISFDELRGLSAGSGFLTDGMCTGRDYTEYRLIRQGDILQVESRLTSLHDAAPKNGVCWAEPVQERAEAAGLPCGQLTTFSGSRLGPLP